MITLILALVAPAQAGPTAHELSAFAEAGVQALPDVYGESHLRAIQHLGAEVPVSDNLQISAMGAWREGPTYGNTGDLYRLALRYQADHFTLTAGRLVRLDARGWLRIDGIAFDGQRDRTLTWSAWAGQLWHPDTFEYGHTVVGGVEAHIDPKGMAGKKLDLGYEAQLGDEPLTHRLHASASAVGPKGGRALAHVEAGLPCLLVDGSGRTGVRAVVSGSTPVGSSLDLGADVRWEGLAPAWQPEGIRTPMDWLAPEGYATAGLRADYSSGKMRAVVVGGPTLRPVTDDLQKGGRARLSVAYQPSHTVQVGVFGTAATMATSGFGGGGVEAGYAAEAMRVDASAGIYQLQPLDGDAMPVWEARVHGEAPVFHKPAGDKLAKELGLAFELAAGTDRQLAPWARAGVAIHGRLGQSYWGRP